MIFCATNNPATNANVMEKLVKIEVREICFDDWMILGVNME